MKNATTLIAAICIGMLSATFTQQTNAEDDILTTAAANGSFKTLVSLVVASDLDEALQSDGEFTVFAPTDEAFESIPAETLNELLKAKNREKLAGVLKYHVLGTEVRIPKRRPSHPITSAKTLQGKRVEFERNGSDVDINGFNIVTRNIRCSNGVIHVIDGVLMPPEDDNTIVGVASKAGSFKTLLAAAKAAGLVEALQSEGPLTVFAPTDKAFSKIPKNTLRDLLKPENKDQLANILKYHVVSGKISARDAIKAGEAKTLTGSKITASIREGRLSINDASVTTNDIETSNGVIHVIDEVLMPPTESHSKTSAKQSSDRH